MAPLRRLLTRLRALADDNGVMRTPRGSSSGPSYGYLGRHREWREQQRAEFRRSVNETASKLRRR